jgi:hypothetical protein
MTTEQKVFWIGTGLLTIGFIIGVMFHILVEQIMA